MAVTQYNDMQQAYAPNPTIQEGQSFRQAYPPVKSDAPYLLNPHNGDVFPNTDEWAKQSDVLVPYYGSEGNETVTDRVNAVLRAAELKAGRTVEVDEETGELVQETAQLADGASLRAAVAEPAAKTEPVADGEMGAL